MDFKVKIDNILNEIIRERELPENSIYMHSNISSKGKNAGNLISISLCISEPAYPPDNNKKKVQNKSYVIMNIKRQSNVELQIRNKQFFDVVKPVTASIKELKSDAIYKHIIFEQDCEELYEYIKINVIYCLENYSSSNSFGCCKLYKECSDQKTCLHMNKLYASGCLYRRNLLNGRIFYGANRNV